MLLYECNNNLSAEQAICMFIFSHEFRKKSKRLPDTIKMSQISTTGSDVLIIKTNVMHYFSNLFW